MKRSSKCGIFFVLPAVLLLVLLSGCMHKTVLKVSNADGTVTKITCDSSGGLTRAPVFSYPTDRSFNMRFSGIEWYCAEILSGAERNAIDLGEVISESSNIKVYRNGADVFPYTYILDLEGTDDSFVRFDSDTEPGQNAIGNDFKTSVTYEVDGHVTVPDAESLPLPEDSGAPD